MTSKAIKRIQVRARAAYLVIGACIGMSIVTMVLLMID